MKKYILAVLITTLCCSFKMSTKAAIHGNVFLDKNNNGKQDAAETGIARVMVSDGLHVVLTNQKGAYVLPGPVVNHFVFITVPNGYQSARFYHQADSNTTVCNFALRKSPGKTREATRFIQITDTETNQHGKWLDDIKTSVRNERPDFIIHTGDICNEKGIRFHSDSITGQTMGVPVYYCVGNHDLVKGAYGEQFYQSLLGPAYYSFEAGNVHFVVTPMLMGDYKPGYTKRAVYEWLKRDLAMRPKNTAVVIFNHDLQSNIDANEFLKQDRFIYAVSDSERLDLHQQGLIAWIYGHWHTDMVQSHHNGVLSICTPPPDKGGIDHSVAAIRLITINSNGKIHLDTRYAYQQQLKIVLPDQAVAITAGADSIKLIVNAYNTTSKVVAVKYRVGEGKEKGTWRNMFQQSSWTWEGAWKPSKPQAVLYQLEVIGLVANGDTLKDQQLFTPAANNAEKIQTGTDWPLMLQNAAHHPVPVPLETAHLTLRWVQNAGAPIYNGGPLIAQGLAIAATIDEGNLAQGKIVAMEAATGQLRWTFKTANSVKGPIAYGAHLVFALDVAGCLYAVNDRTGALAWKRKLNHDFLPANLQGVVISGDTVYTRAGRRVYALHARDGSDIWFNECGGRDMGTTANQTLAGPVLVGASNWNALFANDRNTGQLLWKRDDEGLRFRDAASSYDGNILYATGLKNFFELDPVTGKSLRSIALPVVLSSATPLVTADAIFLGTGSAGIIALDRKTLHVKWNFTGNPAMAYTAPYIRPSAATVESSPLSIGSRIFFGSSDGNLYLLDAATGSIVWKKSLGAPVLAAAALSGNLLVVADYGGNVYGWQINGD